MSPYDTDQLSGLWVPLVTPFRADSTLDETSLEALAHRLLDDGVDGLVALGTTGEPATLTRVERRRVVEICRAACAHAGRRLMVGVGTNSTAGTIDEMRFLTADITVDAVLVVTPYYTRPSRSAVVEHFGLVADESDVPVVIYNIPYRTGVGLDAQALTNASAHPNIAGLKQAVGGLDGDTLDVLRSAPEDFDILAGDDAFIVPTMLMGASGAIAAAAHLATPRFVEMVAAARLGDARRAVRLAHELLPLVHAGFAEPSPAVWKGALAATDQISSGQVRRPLAAATEAAVQAVLASAVN